MSVDPPCTRTGTTKVPPEPIVPNGGPVKLPMSTSYVAGARLA